MATWIGRYKIPQTLTWPFCVTLLFCIHGNRGFLIIIMLFSEYSADICGQTGERRVQCKVVFKSTRKSELVAKAGQNGVRLASHSWWTVCRNKNELWWNVVWPLVIMAFGAQSFKQKIIINCRVVLRLTKANLLCFVSLYWFWHILSINNCIFRELSWVFRHFNKCKCDANVQLLLFLFPKPHHNLLQKYSSSLGHFLLSSSFKIVMVRSD